ncbi:MAG TPA: zf-HC2 domain-containing protein [Candidatus Limnocylindrales bacterium]|nr:zf-HC2 domain-containing protein [Candidatus Limnocylindrales bacterium]
MSPRGRIGRFGRVGRRPDHWSSPHERARTRAAERLEAPLASREEAWLEAHLAECVPCRVVAETYAKDRLALRLLRDEIPDPPRDLWARTAARVEQEAAARRAAGRRSTQPRRGSSLPALGALSGLAVVGVVVVATAIAGGFLGGIGRDAAASPSIALASQVAPQSTAIAVSAGKVHWLGASEDGAFAYNVADIDAVCPHDRQPDCAPFEDGHAKRVTLTATPRFVFQSPVDDQAMVVGTDTTGADVIMIVPLPTPDPTPEATPAQSADASSPSVDEPSESVAATPVASLPSASPTVLVTTLATDLPLDSAASSLPSASESAGAEPTAAAAVAIITDVTVVGRTAAYSPDGVWFAFSARPADGSAGPDIYVWHVGDLQARPLTTDHASVFASWVGGNLLGSRVTRQAAADPDTGEPSADIPEADLMVAPTLEVPPTTDLPPAQELGQAIVPGQSSSSPAAGMVVATEGLPQTFLLDPSTGVEVALIDAEWQPAVDPTGLAVVAWQGTVGTAGDGLTAAPATGNLVLHPFHGPLGPEVPAGSPVATPETSSIAPSPTLSPEPTIDASASSVVPSASTAPEVVRDFPPQVVAAGPIADFDARWDDTGSWLAIWIADPVDPALGRLSLLHFDPFTGLLDRPVGAPQDVTALPGFSIGFGRLAWASPPGQGGEGSRIQIAAWTPDEVGAVESIPVNGAIVVQ